MVVVGGQVQAAGRGRLEEGRGGEGGQGRLGKALRCGQGAVGAALRLWAAATA